MSTEQNDTRQSNEKPPFKWLEGLIWRKLTELFPNTVKTAFDAVAPKKTRSKKKIQVWLPVDRLCQTFEAYYKTEVASNEASEAVLSFFPFCFVFFFIPLWLLQNTGNAVKTEQFRAISIWDLVDRDGTDWQALQPKAASHTSTCNVN